MKEEKLLLLLQKKKGFFEALLELTENEAHLTLPEWISVLEQKKILLSCIDEIDLELDSFKERFHILTQEVHEEIEQIRKVIERILHLDQKNQTKRKEQLQAARRV